MRIIFTLLIIAGIIVALYFAVMTAIAKVSFEIGFKGLDLSNIALDNVISGSSTARVKIGAKLVNRNNFPIRLGNFHIWIYYNNVLMAQSTEEPGNFNKIIMPAHGTAEVTHDVTIYLNTQVLQLLRDLKDRKELRFDYATEFRVYGFPYTYKDYFTYKF